MWAGGSFPTSPHWIRMCAKSRGVRSADRDHPGPHYRGSVMADKSPRQAMSKKSGQTLKQKRAAKRQKADRASSTVDVLSAKQR